MSDIHYHYHGSTEQVLHRLHRIEQLLRALCAQRKIEMATLTDIAAQVTQQATLEASVATLLTSLQAQITAANGNQAQIDSIFAAAQANTAALTAALAANTPAAPVTPQTPATSPVVPTPADTLTSGAGTDSPPASAG